MAFVMLRNEADAEDAAQETFLRAYRKLADFQSESKFSTWLTSIVLNEARGRLQHSKNGVAFFFGLPLESDYTSGSLDPPYNRQESALLSLEQAKLAISFAASDSGPSNDLPRSIPRCALSTNGVSAVRRRLSSQLKASSKLGFTGRAGCFRDGSMHKEPGRTPSAPAEILEAGVA